MGHLDGYLGWVHADDYAGYNDIFGAAKASEMACMAHVRRKFVDIFDHTGLDLSRFDAAPLKAFIAPKETDYGTKTDG